MQIRMNFAGLLTKADEFRRNSGVTVVPRRETQQEIMATTSVKDFGRFSA